MAVIVNGDGILTGISSLATDLTDITSGRGTVTGVATVGTLQLGTGVSISSPRSQNAAIFTNNSEFLTVDDAGRVGVGTVTPNSDAHPQNVGKINVGFITARSVAGDIDANTLVVAGISTFVGAINGSGANLTNLNASNIASGTVPTARLGSGTANNTTFLRGDSTFATVTTTTISGNANNRIITGSATANTLNGESTFTYDGDGLLSMTSTSGACEFTLVGPSDTDSGIYFNDGSNVGALSYQHSDNSMRFRVNSTEKVRIDSSGSVGVNETTPDFSGFGSNGGGIELDDVNSGFTALKVSHGAADMYLASAGSAVFISTRTNHDIIVEKNSAEVARFTANGLKVPSGKGIDFSATGDAGNSASMSSELLDDYEEGAWAPTMATGSATITAARYTKVGRMVTVSLYAHSFTDTSSSSVIQFDNLPFTSDSNQRATGAMLLALINTLNDSVAYVGGGLTNIRLYHYDQGGDYTSLNHSAITSSNSQRRVFLSLTYQAA